MGLFLTLALVSKHIHFSSKEKLIISSHNKKEKILELDMNVSLAASKSTNGRQTISSMEMGIENPEIMIIKVEKKKSSQEKFNNFLSSISNVKSKKTKNLILDDNKNNKSAVNYKSNSINYNVLVKNKPKTPRKTNVSATELKKIVKKYNHKFQSCYEKALIKDELLSGKAIITLTFERSAIVDFKGIGLASSISFLKKCIKNESQKIRSSNHISGKKVRFSLFFNS